jgi:hypothetical protein
MLIPDQGGEKERTGKERLALHGHGDRLGWSGWTAKTPAASAAGHGGRMPSSHVGGCRSVYQHVRDMIPVRIQPHVR